MSHLPHSEWPSACLVPEYSERLSARHVESLQWFNAMLYYAAMTAGVGCVGGYTHEAVLPRCSTPCSSRGAV